MACGPFVLKYSNAEPGDPLSQFNAGVEIKNFSRSKDL